MVDPGGNKGTVVGSQKLGRGGLEVRARAHDWGAVTCDLHELQNAKGGGVNDNTYLYYSSRLLR